MTEDSDRSVLQTLISKYQQLELGQSLDQAIKLLGPATIRRELWRKKELGEPAGVALEYRIGGTSVPNVNDVSITLFFDAADRLIWAYPQNIPAIREMGSRVAVDRRGKRC